MMMDPDYEYCNLEPCKEINGGFLDFPVSDFFTADRSYWRAFALSKEGGEIAKSSIWTTHSFGFHFNHQMEEKKYLKKEQAAYKELYCVIRSMSASESGASRPPNPEHVVH